MIPAPVILCLDVSSSATGYAVFRASWLEGFGLIKPKQSRPALTRIDETVEDVIALLARWEVGRVVMEWSNGKTHGSIGKASGLSVLGAAQGAVRQAVRERFVPVETIDQNLWTGSRKKATRARNVKLIYPEYARLHNEGGDKGLDVADAIGLGWWWIQHNREKEKEAS